jgi:hypothetical protein
MIVTEPSDKPFGDFRQSTLTHKRRSFSMEPCVLFNTIHGALTVAVN